MDRILDQIRSGDPDSGADGERGELGGLFGYSVETVARVA